MEYSAIKIRELEQYEVEVLGDPQYALENYRLRVKEAMGTKELSTINTVRRCDGGKGG